MPMTSASQRIADSERVPEIEVAGSSPVRCAHCDLPVSGHGERFCCEGCRLAHAVITGAGLDRYYRLLHTVDRGTAKSSRPSDQALAFAQFDDPAFERLYIRPRSDGLSELDLLVPAMHCAACIWLLERLPRVIPGVVEVRAHLNRTTVRVTFDPARVKPSVIARTMAVLGYAPTVAREGTARRIQIAAQRQRLVHIAIAGALSGNVMLLAFALYGGEFDGIQPEYRALFRWLTLLLGLTSLFWPGWEFFRSAIATLRTRSVNLDVPIALALAIGAVMGTINTIANRGELYFDSLTMLVFFLLIGRFLQARQQRWAADAVELLYTLTPRTARRLDPHTGRLTEVPGDALVPGDVVEVRAGECIPADGTVVLGSAGVDQSLLTGESQPVELRQADRAYAGCVVVTASLRLQVQAVGAQTRAGALMKMVEDAAARRAPIVQFTNRVAVWFVGVVTALSVLTLLLWWPVDPSKAVQHAAAMLIVTCPCALGLAVPLVLAVAIGRAASRGIFIKGGDVLEQLARPGTLYLDKTGTVTVGSCRVVDCSVTRENLQALAALEAHSAHHTAAAIVQRASSMGVLSESQFQAVAARLEQVTQVTGGGISGVLDGHLIAAGTPAFLGSLGVHVMMADQQAVSNAYRQGLSAVVFAVDGRSAGVLAIGDAIRPDAAPAIRELRRQGWRVRLLSGDARPAVVAVAQRLGLSEEDVLADQTPEQKLAVIRAEQGARPGMPVVMIGDGVNDAAALAASTVGIAVQNGSEAASTAADILLVRPGIAPILEVVDAGRRTMGAIHRTLNASLVYNVAAAGLTLAGLIHPIIAAIFMPLSSLTMLTIAMRARTFAPRRDDPTPITDGRSHGKATPSSVLKPHEQEVLA
jgi:Cu2+-exporting ATPase